MVLEWNQLRKANGRVTFNEYFQYELYDKALSDDEKQRFLSTKLHWPITRAVCDMSWQATTEDKWLCDRLLRQSGIALPEVLAVFDTSARRYSDTHTIKDADGLKDFALSLNGRPFFGKDLRGIASFGAFLCTSADEDFLYLEGSDPITYADFITHHIAGEAYLFQTLQENHKDLTAIADKLVTIRVCILMGKNKPRIPFALAKLPVGPNIADNFWRPGNIACGIDPITGKIFSACAKNELDITRLQVHPTKGTLFAGHQLPFWQQLLELVNKCSPIFAPIHYQSMDIAITPEGPKLIEINTGGGFDLAQFTARRGFLTDEVTEFFIEYGYKGFK